MQANRPCLGRPVSLVLVLGADLKCREAPQVPSAGQGHTSLHFTCASLARSTVWGAGTDTWLLSG